MPITLEAAQAGMVLATDVRDRRGRLLLPAGHQLTARALRIFRMWGVTELEVEGAEPASLAEEEPPIAPPQLEAAQGRAEELFRHTDRRHPLVAELFDLATRRLAREHADAP